MLDIVINYWAVLVGAIAAMVIGAVIYAPPVLGNKWAAMTGKDMKNMNKADANKAMAMLFVVALVQTYILAHFVEAVDATTWMDGAVAGFWIWFGFVVSAMIGNNLFEKRPWGPIWIFLFNAFLTLIVSGAILAVWQ